MGALTPPAEVFMSTPAAPPPALHPLQVAYGVIQRLRARLKERVVGRDDVIDLVIIALLADGHVLLEDFPGSGKTTLARSLGESIVDNHPEDGFAPFRRVQFTPDLLPSDITGTTVFEPSNGQFVFRPGPLFTHVLLADEINRTSPKVQSALLEAMAEKQTTVDNATHKLDDLFFVIATQNPLDLAGTYPLPAAQLDRFMFKIRMTHIARDAELDLLNNLRRVRHGEGVKAPPVGRFEIISARQAIDGGVYVAPAIRSALVDIADASRKHEQVMQGLSTRSLVLSIPALQARAVTCKRDFVNAEDVQVLSRYIFAHRLDLAPGASDVAAVLTDICRRPLEALASATLRR